MRSMVLDPDVAAGLESIAAGIDQVFAAGITPADSADAITLIGEVECQTRRMEALAIDTLNAIDQQGLHRHDGHASAKIMVRHVANLSDEEAARRAKTARALTDLPAVADAFRAGEIGRPQTDRISRAHANPRVREKLCAQDQQLAAFARDKAYRLFDALLTDWVRLTDEDGTCDRAQRNHQNRDASLVQEFDQSWTHRANCGSLQGAEIHDIFKHFIDAEWQSDWEKARAQYGDAATIEHLARTDAQRRFDAHYNIYQRAASSLPGGPGAQIVTNLLLDHQTFERTIRRLTGQRPPTPDIDLYPSADSEDDSDSESGAGSEAEVERGGDGRSAETGGNTKSIVGYRSSTIDGHAVDPTEIVAEALLGHIRRVVIDADSTIIDLSRTRRLFTGAAALAVKLQSYECYWPGCHVNVSDCQIDHLIPWADHSDGDDGGGSTNPSNGGPACGRHNRLKEHGYAAWRDPNGAWHVQRPDGTEIT